MHAHAIRRTVALVACLTLIAVSCGDDGASSEAGGDDTTTTAEPDHATLRVPDDHATIQEAVDAAEAGDLILIGPGTYEEAVVVQTEELVIRGTDRNEVILDGRFEDENGFIIFSDGVAVENLTVRNYTGNGVFWSGGDYEAGDLLTGYRASYVTAHNNGDYGIYAFNAQQGIFEHSYGSGHPDSAFYIGQCDPCDAVVRDVLAENNALGYSGTNSSGNIHIVESEWRNNRLGIVPNSLTSEALAPQNNAVIAGNLVHDNNNPETPQKSEDWSIGFGTGITIVGGNENLVTKNTVVDNKTANIVIFPSPFDPDQIFVPEQNQVTDNVAAGADSYGDLVLVVSLEEASGPLGNCFAGNEFSTSEPADIEAAAPCDQSSDTTGFVIGMDQLQVGPEPIDYQDAPAPDYDFENMPDAESAPPAPAVDLDVSVDLDEIEAPPRPS